MLTRNTFVGMWAGLPVSWTNDNRLDEDVYRGDVERCCKAGVSGIYTGGTTGEFYAMEFDEFKAVARATVEECKRHGVPCMIGCTSTYTLGAARRAAFAAECGADAIQVALPFWMEVPPSEIVPFFKSVSTAAPGLAFSIYETSRTKVVLTLDQHKAIKEAVPQYLMVKATPETLGRSPDGCRQLSEFINVFVSENHLARLGKHGANGTCSAMVYWAPKFILAMERKLREGDWEGIAKDCARLDKMLAFIFSQWVPRGFTDTGFDRLGARAGGFLKVSLSSRGPYPHANPSDIEVWRDWCRENFPEMIAEAGGH